MKIGIHGTELDEFRIDGTRIYLSELLKRFYKFSNYNYTIYHKAKFNPMFSVPIEKYNIKKLVKIPMWTQISFASSIYRDRIDLLWMPLQNLPRIRRKEMKTVVTIHDLAFKKYPEMFPNKDVKKLNLHTDYAVKNASALISVSESTKKDLLENYSYLNNKDITVIHHGFCSSEWNISKNSQKRKNILNKYKITKEYIVYVGAIQPRKNLMTLIKAFEKLGDKNISMQLVCVGADAWMAEDIHLRVDKSKYRKEIVFTGGVIFEDLKIILANAKVFVLPSIHEGFGIPILEAFASKVPVIASNSGSLPEIVGNAGKLFDPKDSNELFLKIEEIISSQGIRERMIRKGIERLNKFSWDKTTRETIKLFDEILNTY